jgi:hypothetical protein
MSVSPLTHSASTAQSPAAVAERDARDVFAFIVAVICGILLGLSAHVVLMRYGTSLTAPWRDLFPSEADKRDAALAWWTMAATACAGGFLAKRLLDLRRDDAGRVRLAAALVLFCVFAFAGHAATPDAARGFAQTLASLSVMALATVMALCGVYAARPRRS